MRFIVFNRFTGRDISIRTASGCITPADMLMHTFGPGADTIWGCAVWPYDHKPEVMIDLSVYDTDKKTFNVADIKKATIPDDEAIAARLIREAAVIMEPKLPADPA